MRVVVVVVVEVVVVVVMVVVVVEVVVVVRLPEGAEVMSKLRFAADLHETPCITIIYMILLLLLYLYIVDCLHLFIVSIIYLGSSAEYGWRRQLPTPTFHNFKSQNLKLSVSNPKRKYVAYVSVLSQISNCQGLGRKNKHEF